MTARATTYLPRNRPPLAALAAALLLTGCGALAPTYEASSPTPGGDDPVPVEVVYVGAESESALILGQQIEDLMIDLSRRPQRDAAAFDAALEIEDHYRQIGFPDAEVDHAIHREGGPQRVERVVVTFTIREGPRCTVESLEFAGNTEISDRTLRYLWFRRHGGFLGTGAPLYVQRDLDNLREDALQVYRSSGHRKAEVRGPILDFDETRESVRVVFEIDEGPLYRFARVDVAPELLLAMGRDAPRPPVGDAASGQNTQQYLITARTVLRAAGHPRPELQVREREADDERHTVGLFVYGDPGPRVRITDVLVRGNERTYAWVIRNQLDLAPGDLYDGRKVDEALRRLYARGLFRRVTVDVELASDTADAAPLVITVEELPSRSIGVLAGWGSYERARGGVRFEERNLFGTGRMLALDAMASTRGHRLLADLVEHDLLDTGTRLTLSAEQLRREAPSFTDDSIGYGVSLDRPLFGTFAGTLGYSRRDHTESNSRVLSPVDIDSYQEGRMFFELRNDRRDNILMPRSGHHESAMIEVFDDALGGDVAFLRARLSASLFVELGDYLRAVLRTDHRAIWPGEGSDRVPIQERLFNGGHNTVRSFKQHLLGPKDGNGLPTGGEFRNVMNAELRAPILHTLEWALFVDAGNVGSDVDDFTLDELDYGIGAGLRLVLPIGPARVDWAINPDPGPGEDDHVLHFSVGYPF